MERVLGRHYLNAGRIAISATTRHVNAVTTVAAARADIEEPRLSEEPRAARAALADPPLHTTTSYPRKAARRNSRPPVPQAQGAGSSSSRPGEAAARIGSRLLGSADGSEEAPRGGALPRPGPPAALWMRWRLNLALDPVPTYAHLNASQRDVGHPGDR
jgi:hypothetical protein